MTSERGRCDATAAMVGCRWDVGDDDGIDAEDVKLSWAAGTAANGDDPLKALAKQSKAHPIPSLFAMSTDSGDQKHADVSKRGWSTITTTSRCLY